MVDGHQTVNLAHIMKRSRFESCHSHNKIVAWCNGSTTDFGSVSWSSNLYETTNYKHFKLGTHYKIVS